MKKILTNRLREVRRWLREPRILWRSENQDLHSTIEVRTWLPFAAFALLFFWYIASPTAVGLMSTVALGGMLLVSGLWARAIARGVRGGRELRFAAMQVGDELEEQITLVNKTPLPVLWAEFVDRSNIPGYTVSSARAADPGARVTWRAQTICTRRGVFTFGPWELRLGEPFGFLRIRQLYLQKQEILVYPPLAVLPEHILPHHGALGDHRPLNQPLRAETIASNSVRAFVPGDPLRHVHWRTTARRGDPYVKVFNPEAASNIWLVPDFNADWHTGAGDDSSEETMVTVTASLAARLLQQNLSVGMLASAEQETVVLPRQGHNHLWAILQALAPLRATPGRTLEDVLSRARALISGNDLLVLVTPSMDPNWIAPLRRISRSRGSTGRAEVILLDRGSFMMNLEPAASAQAEAFLPILLENGITANVLHREDVRIITGFFGEVSRWEFAVLGTGRAVARKAPRAASPAFEISRAAAWKAVE